MPLHKRRPPRGGLLHALASVAMARRPRRRRGPATTSFSPRARAAAPQARQSGSRHAALPPLGPNPSPASNRWSSPSADSGARPSMIAAICSRSIVSYCSSASAIASSLSMFVGQDFARTVVGAIDDAAHDLVDLARGLLGDVLVLGHRATEEHLVLFLGVGHRTELLGQAVLGDHVARELGRALDVVRRAGGDLVLAEDQLFGDAAAVQARKAAFQRTSWSGCSDRPRAGTWSRRARGRAG